MYCPISFFQWAKSPKKRSEGVCFVNSALKIACHIVENTLLQAAFLAILLTHPVKQVKIVFHLRIKEQ